MSKQLSELIPVLQNLVPLIRNELARRGIDTEVGFTSRSKTEQDLARKNGASQAAFGKSWHNTKPPGASKTDPGLIASCAVDLWIPASRSVKTGGVTAFDWNNEHYKVVGEVYEGWGLIWGGSWKRLHDAPHGQAPILSSPREEHWVMTLEELDIFCRSEINKTRKLRGLCSLEEVKW